MFRDLGINIAILADFHSDAHPQDTGSIRLNEQKWYFDGLRRFSDRDLLLIPGEEPDANFGGHYMFLLPRAQYYTHLKEPARPRRAAVCRDHAVRQGSITPRLPPTAGLPEEGGRPIVADPPRTGPPVTRMS